jgi:hypothetical protein
MANKKPRQKLGKDTEELGAHGQAGKLLMGQLGQRRGTTSSPPKTAAAKEGPKDV